ncbi:hypothetical protein D3C76_1136180 [compost metagenome]
MVVRQRQKFPPHIKSSFMFQVGLVCKVVEKCFFSDVLTDEDKLKIKKFKDDFKVSIGRQATRSYLEIYEYDFTWKFSKQEISETIVSALKSSGISCTGKIPEGATDISMGFSKLITP